MQELKFTLKKLTGARNAQIEFSDDLNIAGINRLANQKQTTGRIIFDDNRHITTDQRKLIYGLLGDLANYTGDDQEYWEDYFKYQVCGIFDIDRFSLSDCSITTARYMILTILDFLFTENIPFKRKWWYELDSDYPLQALCIKNKTCVICGTPKADIAHYRAVGRGRNRNKINHVGMYVMTLCRNHHTEQHTIGIKEFCTKYHIKPIKVTEEIAKKYKLGVVNNESI